jgi:hypothetical protein
MCDVIVLRVFWEIAELDTRKVKLVKLVDHAKANDDS